VLGATGHRELWTQHAAPVLHHRLTPAVFHGIDSTVRKILDHGTAGLIAVSVVLSIWYLTAAMRAVIEALDQIHDVEDTRPWSERIATALLLGAMSGGCLFAAVLIVVAGPRGLLLGLVAGRLRSCSSRSWSRFCSASRRRSGPTPAGRAWARG
jgi:uncharacterized BrkB/YihY/UPF0761 family membrane protein